MMLGVVTVTFLSVGFQALAKGATYKSYHGILEKDTANKTGTFCIDLFIPLSAASFATTSVRGQAGCLTNRRITTDSAAFML